MDGICHRTVFPYCQVENNVFLGMLSNDICVYLDIVFMSCTYSKTSTHTYMPYARGMLGWNIHVFRDAVS